MNIIIMADIKTKEERSRNMSAIHSKDTDPEVYFRKLLFAKGIRYRKNVSYIPGHPDLYLKKYNTAIFVNGCFWHRHTGCKFAYMPKSRLDFWENKFVKNRTRDENVRKALANAGIRQLVIWECTIKKMKKNLNLREDIIEAVVRFLDNGASYMEF